MEGAAFGYVCGKLGVDCVQVRAVSNFCGKRDEQEWNFSKAVNNLKTFFDSADI
jgi:futalosine hydrolase